MHGEEHFGVPVNVVWRQAGNIPYEPTKAEERADRKARGEAFRAEQRAARAAAKMPKRDPFAVVKGGGWGEPPASEPQAYPGGTPVRSRSPAKPRSRAPRPKPRCKYGPRGADGYCPPKPKAARAISARAAKPYKLPRSLSRSAGAVGRTTAAAVVGATARAAIKGAPLIKQLLKTPVTKIVGAVGARAAAGTAGAVLGAGLLSYYVTSKIIEARKRKRMKRAEEAGIAADGYREARRALEQQQGRPLNAEQQRILAYNFKQQLEALGLSTSDLGGL